MDSRSSRDWNSGHPSSGLWRHNWVNNIRLVKKRVCQQQSSNKATDHLVVIVWIIPAGNSNVAGAGLEAESRVFIPPTVLACLRQGSRPEVSVELLIILGVATVELNVYSFTLSLLASYYYAIVGYAQCPLASRDRLLTMMILLGPASHQRLNEVATQMRNTTDHLRSREGDRAMAPGGVTRWGGRS